MKREATHPLEILGSSSEMREVLVLDLAARGLSEQHGPACPAKRRVASKHDR